VELSGGPHDAKRSPTAEGPSAPAQG